MQFAIEEHTFYLNDFRSQTYVDSINAEHDEVLTKRDKVMEIIEITETIKSARRKLLQEVTDSASKSFKAFKKAESVKNTKESNRTLEELQAMRREVICADIDYDEAINDAKNAHDNYEYIVNLTELLGKKYKLARQIDTHLKVLWDTNPSISDEKAIEALMQMDFH